MLLLRLLVELLFSRNEQTMKSYYLIKKFNSISERITGLIMSSKISSNTGSIRVLVGLSLTVTTLVPVSYTHLKPKAEEDKIFMKKKEKT